MSDQILEQNIKRRLGISKVHASLGMIDADGKGHLYDQDDPNSGKVYVRYAQSGGLSVQTLVDGPIPAGIDRKVGTNIILLYDKNDELYIADLDRKGTRAVGGNINAVGATNSEVRQDDLLTGKVVPTNPPSLMVNIKAWRDVIDGVAYQFKGKDNFDLSSFVPSSDDKCYVGVFIQDDYLTVEAFSSTPIPITDPDLGTPDVQEILDLRTPDSTILAVVELTDGQPSIDKRHIYDWRRIVNNGKSGGGGSGSISVAIFEEQQAAGTAGGTFTSGADRTRTINTEVSDPDGIATLSGNQITISVAGTYEINWWAAAHAVDQNQSLLWDITNGALLKEGEATNFDSTSHVTGKSSGAYIITLSGSLTIELRHRCATTKATDGFGVTSAWYTQVFSQVIIRKIA